MKVYNKLVRDNIEDIMLGKGLKPVTRILSDEEYLKELNKKLLEEVNEYLESEEPEEIADIEEVILAILKTKGLSRDDIEKIRKDKSSKRGAFDKKLFLERED
ncbi:MAG: nucleoside triphosphate pyrophosphohydrolase [Bacilli bacterium]|nr:nucleoside triphosphate pyrophosphohydrolase [Bacilli bacterium]